jgi:YegS/Rv2252/BmrU family lipid kinase
MRVKVIVNPAAGKPESVLSVLDSVFGPADIDWNVSITHKAGDGMKAARKAADKGYDLIGAYGGDGTVSEVAAGLAEGGPPMLLLPGGTGNALAEDLGIPVSLIEAAALAVGDAGTAKPVDLGRYGTRWFVQRMTMGFEATMVHSTTRKMKDRYGWLAYALSALRSLSDPPMATYSMNIDGKAVECSGLAALVANSASTGLPGVRIASDVDVSDGLLDVIVIEGDTLPMLLGSAVDAAQGIQPRALSRWRAKEVRVTGVPVQRVIADGEDAGRTPVEVSVAAGAIRVLVPKAGPTLDSTRTD